MSPEFLQMSEVVSAANWPFKDPPNVAVFVNRRILHESAWIAYVSHDADDGAWQFHTSDSTPPRQEDATIVALRQIVQLDPAVSGLADLPLGWHAWRKSRNSEWHRAQGSSRRPGRQIHPRG